MRQKQGVFSLFLLSPSSRRAWIEIAKSAFSYFSRFSVALLAEGVDRNFFVCFLITLSFVALLAEGVDRNPLSSSLATVWVHVALLAEGVDRNLPLAVC